MGGLTYGVAKDVNLIAVRVMDASGSGTVAGVIAGIDWARNNIISNGAPAVISMSLGTSGVSSTWDAAINNCVAAGITFVASAGNDNRDACLGTPGSSQAIIVGATDISDNRASFSNFGSCLEIFAPGAAIWSTYIGSDTSSVSLSGTSMAAPHVAGAAATYLQTSPGANQAAVTAYLQAQASADVVQNRGAGSVNLLLNIPVTVPTIPPTGAPTSSPTQTPATDAPTSSPTSTPATNAPTSSPTTTPATDAPTSAPTSTPATNAPTSLPTSTPVTGAPTSTPATDAPTSAPTFLDEPDEGQCYDTCINKNGRVFPNKVRVHKVFNNGRCVNRCVSKNSIVPLHLCGPCP